VIKWQLMVVYHKSRQCLQLARTIPQRLNLPYKCKHQSAAPMDTLSNITLSDDRTAIKKIKCAIFGQQLRYCSREISVGRRLKCGFQTGVLHISLLFIHHRNWPKTWQTTFQILSTAAVTVCFTKAKNCGILWVSLVSLGF